MFSLLDTIQKLNVQIKDSAKLKIVEWVVLLKKKTASFMLHITYNLSDDFGWNGNGGLDVDEHSIPTDKMNHEYLTVMYFQ